MKNTTMMAPQVLPFNEFRKDFPKAWDRLIEGDIEGWPKSEGPFPLKETTEAYRKHWTWAVDDRQVLVGLAENDGWGFSIEWHPDENNWFFLAAYEDTCAIEQTDEEYEENEDKAGKVHGKYPRRKEH